MTRLILWDIDGTLCSCGPAGRHALEAAAAEVAALAEVPRVVMGGRTDQWILREILRAAGVPAAEIETLLPAAMDAAVKHLAASEHQIRREGVVHPGVRDVLDQLAAMPGVTQTLVTGNLKPNAIVKTAAFGLDDYFDFDVGAYGSDHHDRNELVPMAIDRVRTLRGGSYPADAVWVIGDTEHDLACARAGQARCFIVANRPERWEELKDLSADAVAHTLADVDAVMRVLLGP